MKRREFLTLIGGAAAGLSCAAQAQQPARPVIGYLSAQSKAAALEQTAKFNRGLNEMGFVDGQNVAIEYRWADGQYERLPAMATELVRRPVDLIVAQAPPAALAAKAATSIEGLRELVPKATAIAMLANPVSPDAVPEIRDAQAAARANGLELKMHNASTPVELDAAFTTIPIVFVVGVDPIAVGLVESLSLPSGNATGMTLMTGPLSQKRIEGLRELVPKATAIAMLANPVSPDAVPEIRDAQAAARANGLELKMHNASTPVELDAALGANAAQHPDALLVGSDPFLLIRRNDLVAFAARYQIPTIYPFREFADSGGLISYGTNIATAYRQAGIYAGRILKGAKPAELPVVQPTKFELVINLKTAKTLFHRCFMLVPTR
jgi:putative tryptophan/tyrosine transport system substrate-binding protein